MIRDLISQGAVEAAADVVIIGAGTAGLPVSVWLAEAGLNVICLESGGRNQDRDEHPLNEIVHVEARYAGATEGRFRALAGTSTRWGGALIPFLAEDLRGWPVSLEDLQPYIAKIEEVFDLAPGRYDEPTLTADTPTHVARLAKWPPFKKRNVYNLVGEKAETLPNLTVWLNATVTQFQLQDGQYLKAVHAKSAAGDKIVARAPRFIVAAGAIETTRLALMMNAKAGSPALGRYFGDHLSVVVGELEVSDRRALNRHVGFRFERNGTMRNLRFELAEAPEARALAPSHFVHVGFETRGQGGFEVVRSIFRRLQKREIPRPTEIFGLLRTAPWLARALWARYVGKRLLFPDGARFPVHVVLEQAPSEQNFIALSTSKFDALGSPMVELSWKPTEADAVGLLRAADATEAMWPKLPLGKFSRFIRRDRKAAEADLSAGGGIYHPTGSTRMGSSVVDGVVDRNLRMFSVPNVQLLSTSVLPTGGGANPTMMLLLLAARCVDQHYRAQTSHA